MMIGKEDYDQAITYYREGNYKEAVMWFRKSAEQGLANAQYNLGKMYFEGRGLVQSDSEAVKWPIFGSQKTLQIYLTYNIVCPIHEKLLGMVLKRI